MEEDSKYSEEEKPFQREMHLNDPNKLFVLEETQAIQRTKDELAKFIKESSSE